MESHQQKNDVMIQLTSAVPTARKAFCRQTFQISFAHFKSATNSAVILITVELVCVRGEREREREREMSATSVRNDWIKSERLQTRVR